MRSLWYCRLTRPHATWVLLWNVGHQVRSMAISPWGDDSREVKRWGYTDSAWRILHRRLRLHGVRLPKKWILDPNKNYNMLGNIKQMKEFGMTNDQQRKALMEGVFLFTKDPWEVKRSHEYIMGNYNFSQEKMNDIMATNPVILDLKLNTKLAPFMAKLSGLGYTRENVKELVGNYPLVMTHPIRMIRKITERYVGLGLSCDDVVKMVSTDAHYMLDNGFDSKIEKILRWFHIFLGADMRKVLQHPTIFLSTIARIKESYWWLHDDASFEKNEIKEMVNRCPMMLGQTYQHLRIKLSFAMDHLKQRKIDVVNYPYFFPWPFARLSSRIGFLDHKELNFQSFKLPVIFNEEDEIFVRKVKGIQLEEYKAFEAWWMSITDVAKLDALQHNKYNIDEPDGEKEVQRPD